MNFDVAIVGSGIAAIALLEELVIIPNVKIVMINSGRTTEYSEVFDSVSENHHPLNECSNTGFGGTSKTWGGRCADYNQVDFQKRVYVEGEWPLNKNNLTPFYMKACEFLDIGEPNFDFEDSDSLASESAAFSSSTCERWSLPLRLGKRRKAVEDNSNVTIFDDFHVQKLEKNTGGYNIVSSSSDVPSISATICIVASGGLGSTKLLLNSLTTNDYPALGKYYQGHLSGKIANVIFNEPKSVDYAFKVDNGVYTRWRYQPTYKTMAENNLLNTALWLDNLPVSDSKHGNPILSFVFILFNLPLVAKYLAPPSIRKAVLGNKNSDFYRHIMNIVKGVFSVIKFALPFFFKRYIFKRKIPGFFLYSPHGEYALHFHAEQQPLEENCIVKKPISGFDVFYGFSMFDCESVIKTHELLDDFLKTNNIGHLEYYLDDKEKLKKIISQACLDGIHQTGSTRMSKSKEEGVVDSNLEVFDFYNLFILSSSVFPTSSQANPTFLLVVMAKKMASLISQRLK
jgi:hypothetical protein